jgi:hypothetical protein
MAAVGATPSCTLALTLCRNITDLQLGQQNLKPQDTPFVGQTLIIE